MISLGSQGTHFASLILFSGALLFFSPAMAVELAKRPAPGSRTCSLPNVSNSPVSERSVLSLDTRGLDMVRDKMSVRRLYPGYTEKHHAVGVLSCFENAPSTSPRR